MVELGEHCHTHIIPRLKKVIDGTDQGGITEAVEWKGGGGFRYYRLAPSLLEKDKFGNWVISKQYNAAMLAEAMCKSRVSPTRRATPSTGYTGTRLSETSSTSPRRRSPETNCRSSAMRLARTAHCWSAVRLSESRTFRSSRT